MALFAVAGEKEGVLIQEDRGFAVLAGGQAVEGGGMGLVIDPDVGVVAVVLKAAFGDGKGRLFPRRGEG